MTSLTLLPVGLGVLLLIAVGPLVAVVQFARLRRGSVPAQRTGRAARVAASAGILSALTLGAALMVVLFFAASLRFSESPDGIIPSRAQAGLQAVAWAPAAVLVLALVVVAAVRRRVLMLLLGLAAPVLQLGLSILLWYVLDGVVGL